VYSGGMNQEGEAMLFQNEDGEGKISFLEDTVKRELALGKQFNLWTRGLSRRQEALGRHLRTREEVGDRRYLPDDTKRTN